MTDLLDHKSSQFRFFGRPAEVFYPVGLSENYGAIVNARSDISEYESGLSQFLEKNIRPDGYFIDIGAQIGLFSLLGSLIGARTISIEMRSSLVKAHYLSKEANQLSNWLPLNFAMDHGVGIIPYTDDAQFALIDGNADARSSTDTVLAVALDQIEPVLGGLASGIIKMDIEGFEVRALMGAQKVLKSTRPIVCVECHPHPAYLYGTNISQIKELLPPDYRLFAVGDHRLGRGVEVTEVYEVGAIADNFLLFCVPRERGVDGLVRA